MTQVLLIVTAWMLIASCVLLFLAEWRCLRRARFRAQADGFRLLEGDVLRALLQEEAFQEELAELLIVTREASAITHKFGFASLSGIVMATAKNLYSGKHEHRAKNRSLLPHEMLQMRFLAQFVMAAKANSMLAKILLSPVGPLMLGAVRATAEPNRRRRMMRAAQALAAYESDEVLRGIDKDYLARAC